MQVFSNTTQIWFQQTFAAPTPVQRKGWELIGRGDHVLLVAPTGSGKTLAAFLWAIDRLTRLAPDVPAGVRVLYISPLKALVYDVERNLRAPLIGVQRAAQRLGASLRDVRVDVRTGDTPQRDRRQQLRFPADILVTTPESLFLLLGSRARETLHTVHTVIVDEIHALAPSKRGSHLALSLERLAELAAPADPQRIGLSATVRPQQEVAHYLGGRRRVEIVDADEAPKLELEICVPVPDMENAHTPVQRQPTGGSILGELYAREVGIPRTERGIWPAIYPQLLDQVRANRSTIVFVNSRGLCERLAQQLNDLAGEQLVRAHHGSVSHAKRMEIEDGLKAGSIRGIVATSSLELGIDMGSVDLVILVESPGSVARGLQRIGRAGHQIEAISVGKVFPKFRGDLLECAVIAQRMHRGQIEAIQTPQNPLDVLAQQVVAMCCQRPRTVSEVKQLVRGAHPYRRLSGEVLDAVLSMLSGHYPSTEFADLRPLLSWDRATDSLSARRGTEMLSRMNAGTIPDRGNYPVYLAGDGPRVGELDEEMVFESRAGDTFFLGASTWRVEEITRDRVIVSPAPGEPGRLPFWRGDGTGRPLEVGYALGAFTRELASKTRAQALESLRHALPLSRFAAENLVAYVFDQKEQTGTLPTDRAITIERFRDELGDWRVCVLTPFGSRIHAPWAMAVQRRLGEQFGLEVQVMYTDDGIVLRFADVEDLPGLDVLLPQPEDIETLVTEQLESTSLFAGLFRENAVRALLLARRRPNQRHPLWSQRIKAQQLLTTVRRYPSFPIVLETYRQCLRDIFDLPGLKALLGQVRARQIKVDEVETRSASPFARSLVFAYVAAYIYEQDTPIAERKAQAITLDRNLLAELLGQAELRELIDPEVLAKLEADLQGLTEDRKARDHHEVHDLLRRVGDLSHAEIAARTTQSPEHWLTQLERERRAVQVMIAEEQRWIMAEDSGLYRDALGCMPPAGLPDAYLKSVQRPLDQMVRRYARCHGPFLTAEIAARYALPVDQLNALLRTLAAEGTLVHGEIRPGGAELDWCDVEVLRRIKRLTLAKLRNVLAPAEAETLGLFLPQWQGIGTERGGPERIEDVIAQIEGLTLPWSVLNQIVFPARIQGFSLDMLDALAASGAVVWVGCGALGPGDGRLALYRRNQAKKLLTAAPSYEPPSQLHAAILDHLGTHGASFLTVIEQTVTEALPAVTSNEFKSALWDLVWAGQITNDTFQPLRSLSSRSPKRVSRRGRWGHTLAGGRWSRVAELVDPRVSDTERALARATMLLERYGIVSREAVRAENMAGGFSPIYTTLKAMEQTGKIRRGYFIEGLSGAQFGYAGAIDRMRALRSDREGERRCSDEDAVTLATVDPANPYGALLPWPATAAEESARPRRSPGNWVILVQGRPVLYVGAAGRQLFTFPSMVSEQHAALAVAFRALRGLPRLGRRRLLIVEKIDGISVEDSPHYELIKSCGFARDYRGLTSAAAS